MSRHPIEPGRPTVIVFDYGGVLAGPSSHHFDERAAAVVGISPQQFRATWRRLRPMVTSGDAAEDEFWRSLLEASESEAGLDEVHAMLASSDLDGDVNLTTIAMAQRLADRGYQLAILSNAPSAFRRSLPATIVELFPTIVVSSEIKVAKPDPRAFEALTAALGEPLDAMLLIDDVSSNVEAAMRCRMDAILYVDEDQLEAELISRGLLEPS